MSKGKKKSQEKTVTGPHLELLMEAALHVKLDSECLRDVHSTAKKEKKKNKYRQTYYIGDPCHSFRAK